MKKNINKFMHSRLAVIILIIVFIISIVIAGTYAWFIWSSKENTTLTMTIGNLADVVFESGPDINTNSLAPVFNYYDGEKTSLEIVSKNNGSEIALYTISLNITTISPELSNEGFKYRLLKIDENGNVLKEKDGSFNGQSDGSSIILTRDYLLTSNIKYEFYIYIDGNVENDLNMMNKTFIGSIGVTAEGFSEVTVTEYISNIYNDASKAIVTNNNIEYNYAASVSMMNDRLGGTTTSLDEGNIRYYGKDPDNYIYFNCNDYNNQTKDTCELWRIIGVFGDKVKIVRDTSIGIYSWDNKDTTTGAESDYGKNDWTTARLMKLLNPSEYYQIDSNDNGLGQSLYYNSESGTCYAGANNATKTCDFTKIGLKNDETKNKIAEIKWNIGGHNSSQVYSDQIYNYERGTKVYSGRPATWTGKIGLMYASDYGYAADFISCNSMLDAYNDETCISTNYLYKGLNDWFLVPNSLYVNQAWLVVTGYVHSNGYVRSSATTVVRPVLYLSADEIIELDTTGTLDDPYKLKP